MFYYFHVWRRAEVRRPGSRLRLLRLRVLLRLPREGGLLLGLLLGLLGGLLTATLARLRGAAGLRALAGRAVAGAGAGGAMGCRARAALQDAEGNEAGERRGTEMRRQTDQMLPLFRSGDMYRETLMALSSFDPSTRRNPAALLDELGGFLDRAWQKSNPQALAPPV